MTITQAIPENRPIDIIFDEKRSNQSIVTEKVKKPKKANKTCIQLQTQTSSLFPT